MKGKDENVLKEVIRVSVSADIPEQAVDMQQAKKLTDKLHIAPEGQHDVS